MTRPSRRRDATPLATIARALADADREPASAVAKRFGVSTSTLRTWRHRATKEPELGELLEQARRRALDTWRAEVAMTFGVVLAEIRRRVAAQEELPIALIGLTKSLGAVCVESEALLGLGREGEGLQPAAPGTRGASSEEVRH